MAATAAAMVVVLLAPATVGATPTPMAAAAGSPLTFPVPANSSLGAFHLLTALQCKTTSRVPTGDDTSAVCESPITDVTARTTWKPVRGVASAIGTGTSTMAAGARGEVSGRRGDWLHWGEQLSRLRNRDVAGRVVHAVTFNSLPTKRNDGDGDVAPNTQLLQEDSVLRMLTLQRNSISGMILRLAGLYDVLSVSRVTVGMCQTRTCEDLSAVNVIGSRKGDYYNETHLPLLTYTDGSGVATPVSMADEDLLSLGRAVVVDPTWLDPAGSVPESATAADSWASRAGFTLNARDRMERAKGPPIVTDPLGPEWNPHSMWDPANRSSTARAGREKWLQAVAHTFCQPPASSFVVTDRDRLCHGNGVERGGGALAVDTPHKRAIHTAFWTWDPDHWLLHSKGRPDQARSSDLPPCAFSNTARNWSVTDPVVRPAWLAGHSSREVNPRSASEVALARSINPCAHPLAAQFDEAAAALNVKELPRIMWSPDARYALTRDATRLLAEHYDRSTWGVAPPPDPASASAIILAVIVVLPEAIAIVAMLLSTRRWETRDLTALAIISMGGLLSTVGLVWLTMEEAAGARWRGTSMRDELTAILPGWDEAAEVYRSLSGASLVRVQTLFLSSRRGYRVELLAGLTSAVGVAYLALFTAIAIVALRGQRRPRKSSVPASVASDD
ncbi:hypothetical protein MMPV_009045 [Pyropia vietnamensis]